MAYSYIATVFSSAVLTKSILLGALLPKGVGTQPIYHLHKGVDEGSLPSSDRASRLLPRSGVSERRLNNNWTVDVRKDHHEKLHQMYPSGMLGGSFVFNRANPLGNYPWRLKALKVMVQDCGKNGGDCRKRDIYEFGVYTGLSMRGMSVWLKEKKVNFGHMWGFDSFEGLPKDRFANKTYIKFGEGTWNPSVALQKHSKTALMKNIYSYVDDSRVHLVPGFYDTSLTSTLAEVRKMKPALYIDIDCDIYTSTVQALDWMFRNSLVVPGTLIGYDDWSHPAQGEQHAHEHIAKKYQVQFAKLPSTFAACPTFKVVSIGETP